MTKVITYGTFDLFHQGHYNLLKRAKALGDYLIVGVTTEHFDEARGKLNVVDPIMTRIENVKSTGLADEIIIEDHDGQKIEDIQKYGADIFTVGSDWVGTFDYLGAYCKVIYIKRTPDISSTQIRKSQYKIVQVGIIGTGRIAPRFISEAKYVSGMATPYAFNPDIPNAMQFEQMEGIQVFTDSYEEFLNKVDAVYIASPHDTHYKYTKLALQYGKHVLCEKPMTFTRHGAEELYYLAHENHSVLMEGIKAAYCPGFQQLINVARSGKIGEIRDVEACFSRLADPFSRERTDPRYGGSFLEFGGYPLLPIIKLLGVNYQKVEIDSINDVNGIDLYTKIQLRYPDAMATAKTGVGVKSEGNLVIAGTKGYIIAQSPWWLTKHFDIRYENASQIESFNPNFQGDGLRYEISEFINKINHRDKKDYKLTSGESIAMAEIVEKFMEKRTGHKLVEGDVLALEDSIANINRIAGAIDEENLRKILVEVH